MLPFLKRNQEASASTSLETQERKPDEGTEEFDSMESAAQELVDAVHAKDVKAVAAALRAAFELMELDVPEDSEPNFNR